MLPGRVSNLRVMMPVKGEWIVAHTYGNVMFRTCARAADDDPPWLNKATVNCSSFSLTLR